MLLTQSRGTRPSLFGFGYKFFLKNHANLHSTSEWNRFGIFRSAEESEFWFCKLRVSSKIVDQLLIEFSSYEDAGYRKSDLAKVHTQAFLSSSRSIYVYLDDILAERKARWCSCFDSTPFATGSSWSTMGQEAPYALVNLGFWIYTYFFLPFQTR